MKSAALIVLQALCLAALGENAPPPEAPKFGKPGEQVFSTVLHLKKPKKSAKRTEGGLDHVFFTLLIPDRLKNVCGIYHTPFNLDTVEKQQSRAMAAHWPPDATASGTAALTTGGMERKLGHRHAVGPEARMGAGEQSDLAVL